MRKPSIQARIWARRKQKLAAIAVAAFIFYAIGAVGNSDYQDQLAKTQGAVAYPTP